MTSIVNYTEKVLNSNINNEDNKCIYLFYLVNRITFDEITDAKCNVENDENFDEINKEVLNIVDKARTCIYDRMEYFKVL